MWRLPQGMHKRRHLARWRSRAIAICSCACSRHASSASCCALCAAEPKRRPARSADCAGQRHLPSCLSVCGATICGRVITKVCIRLIRCMPKLQGLHRYWLTYCTCCKVGARWGPGGLRRSPSQQLLWRHELPPAAVCGSALWRSCLGIYHRSAWVDKVLAHLDHANIIRGKPSALALTCECKQRHRPCTRMLTRCPTG